MSASPGLNYIALESPHAGPPRDGLLLHGILGSGSNWRTFVRQLLADPRMAGWRFVLPDLRGHGDSPGSGGGAEIAGPHTVAACADDCAALERALGRPFVWVLGHSFGGKVATELVRRDAASARALWLLDSPPAPVTLDARQESDDGLLRVLGAIEAMGQELAGREEAIAGLRAHGIGQATAMWLGTNVRRRSDGLYGWKFRLPVIRDLLEDYMRLDALPWLGGKERPEVQRVLVRGQRSDRFDAAALEALEAAEALAVLELEGAGHWLHVDNPEGLRAMCLDRIPGQSA